jgi:hemin uptake protein HemP
MLRKLVKVTEIDIDGQDYTLRFYEQKTVRGMRRVSCEVLLGAGDRIILDDDSMMSLESKVERLVPATVYSRLLASRPSVAA